MPDHSHIHIRGARQHNLKNVDLTIPRDRLVVFTMAPASLPWHLIRRKVNGGMWNRSAPMHDNFWGRSKNPMSIISKA
jgi:hypothetical protein